MTKVSVTISMDHELAEELRQEFGFGRVSPYVVSLIRADRESLRGTNQESEGYASVVSILRGIWFKTNNWKRFQDNVDQMLLDWKDETHPKSNLYSILSEIRTTNLKELVTKWLKYEDFDESDIAGVFNAD